MVVLLNVTCMSCKKAKKNRLDLTEYIYLDALELSVFYRGDGYSCQIALTNVQLLFKGTPSLVKIMTIIKSSAIFARIIDSLTLTVENFLLGILVLGRNSKPIDYLIVMHT